VKSIIATAIELAKVLTDGTPAAEPRADDRGALWVRARGLVSAACAAVIAGQRAEQKLDPTTGAPWVALSDTDRALLAPLARGTPVAFTVSVTDVAGRLKAAAFPAVDVSVEVDGTSTGAVSIGGSTVTSADLANAIGSREDGLKWADLHDVYAVCPAGLVATLKVRAVIA
jgi:hypothetical protein